MSRLYQQIISLVFMCYRLSDMIYYFRIQTSINESMKIVTELIQF